MNTLQSTAEDSTLIRCLDHGYVRLVDHMGSDLSIVRSARVSYNAEWRTGKDSGSDAKLINYLMSHGHNTPFESVTFTFEVKAPIFVVRQWHRHRTQSYNEVSARYTELPEEFYVPAAEHIGTASKNNKQGRDMEQAMDGRQLVINEGMCISMQIHNQKAFALYTQLLEGGMPRELARTVLPVATYTRMFATMNLHNLFRFLAERLDEHAQYEIRQYAVAIEALIYPIVPEAVRAFENMLDAHKELPQDMQG